MEVQQLFEDGALLAVLLYDLLVFLYKPDVSFDGKGGLFGGHAPGPAQDDLPEGADVVLDGLEGVVGVAGDLFYGLLLDKELVNDDAFVGEGRSHIMNGGAAGENLVVFGLPFADVFGHGKG